MQIIDSDCSFTSHHPPPLPPLSSHLLCLLLLLQVGFFPCDCVELINDKIPDSVQNSVPKPGASSG